MAYAKPWKSPMEEAYNNKDFNKYHQGPGVNLPPELQPVAMAAKNSDDRTVKQFKLCLKNVPKGMTVNAVQNLCAQYAKVLRVNEGVGTPYWFAAFASYNDMERALKGLKNNEYGIVAELANNSCEKNGGTPDYPKTTPSVEDNQNGINMSRRVIKGPFTNPQRPNPIQQKPLVTQDDYKNSNLSIVDPQQHFLITQDMHNNDRMKDNKDKRQSNGNDGPSRQMHTGRSYFVESKEVIDKYTKLSESSEGKYNPDKNEFTKSSNKMDLNSVTIGNCSLCKKLANKICLRCGDFYCSRECQTKDWPVHLYKCFLMPDLVSPDTPLRSNVPVQNLPSNNQNQSHKSQESISSNNPSVNSNRNVIHNKMIQQKSPQAVLNKSQDSISSNTNQNFRQNKMHQQKSSPQQNPSQNSDRFKENKKPENNNDFKLNTNDVNKRMQRPNNIPQSDLRRPFNKPEEKIIPEIKKIEPKKRAITNAEFPKSGSPVTITTILKSNLLYVRSMNSEDNTDYIRTLNIIENEGKKAKPITKMPERSDILITDFQDAESNRVLVLNPDSPDNITVAYIDFGNIDTKKLTDLKELPDKIYDLKKYALPVQLKDVGDFTLNEKSLEYINTYVDLAKHLKIIYDEKSEDGIEAELIDIKTNESLNKKILELSEVKKAELKDVPVLSTDIAMELIAPGENVPVYIFDNSLLSIGYVSCIHEKDVLAVEQFNVKLREYAEKVHEPYCPRVNELCVVKYEEDGMWYRAECVETVGDGNPTVTFIDFGNMTMSNVNNIRKYPKDLKHPCMTSSCIIEGLPEEPDAELVEKTKLLLPINNKIIIDRIDIKDNANVITVKKVTAMLKNHFKTS